MNVYDFDRTIFPFDSTARFYLWCLRRYPKIAARWPKTAWAAIRYALGRIDKTAFKGVFLSFLKDVPDPRGEILRFWDARAKYVNRWYIERRRPDDMVISASPEALVRPACERLGIRYVIASPVDIETGAYSGRNCDGAEKVRAFLAACPGGEAEEFYSDSLHDAPMARRAKRAYLVRGDKLTKWPEDSLKG